jgi:dihydropteroate synthase type 2
VIGLGSSTSVLVERPRIVGIVNITTDSFSDGGRYLSPAAALAHARRLRAAGADIIELGPASSHPDAEPVTAEEERRRLAPVIEALMAEDVPVSVDSFLPGTQRYALSRGVAYLNDIRGFPDESVYGELAGAQCQLVVMHSVHQTRHTARIVTDPAETLAHIDRFFTGRLAALSGVGIGPDRLIIDPGLGYFLGSNSEPSLAVLTGLRELKARFGLPLLISASRKSFLRTITGRSVAQIGPASLAAELYAAGQGVDFIRTHDVAALNDGLTVLEALATPGVRR